MAAPVGGQAPACRASINGVSVEGRTIKISSGSNAVVQAAVPAGSAQNSVYLELFGKRLEIASAKQASGTWSGNVPVKDYARWGVGLYRLVWESRDLKGELVCRAAANIHVEGFPLRTLAGATGVAAMAVGLTALTLTLKATINAGARWTIKVVARGKVERDKEERRLRLRPGFSISQTLLGTLWGLLLGGGTLTTLQQTALSPPTIELALEMVLPFTVLGLLAGLLRPVAR